MTFTQMILSHLEANNGASTVEAIADELGIPVDRARRILHNMTADGYVERSTQFSVTEAGRKRFAHRPKSAQQRVREYKERQKSARVFALGAM